MRRRMEAVRSDTPAPQSRGRRLAWRLCLIASTFGLFAISIGIQPAAAKARGLTPEITSTSNNHCAGEVLTVFGKNFGPAGSTDSAHFKQLLANGGTNQ